MAEAGGHAFEVYYDAFRLGRHYGSGETGESDPAGIATELGLLTGGLVAGGRHLEAAALALQRFQTTVVCTGTVAFANLLAVLAEPSGAEVLVFAEDDLAGLYDTMLTRLGLSWPDTAVMVNGSPSPRIAGIDAYLYPEILYPRAVGIEASASTQTLDALRERGVRRINTAAVTESQQTALRGRGFHVEDLGLVAAGDDFATVTQRLAVRWQEQRRGWILGDPVLVSSWLPFACREHRAAIFGVPQSRVIKLLEADIRANAVPAIYGRQFHDSDFFALSRLGQAFQVIDPTRPPLPVLQTLPAPWSTAAPDPRVTDPSDDELRDHARHGRVLVSLAFWTGMVREVENLYALFDLVAMTGLRAGIVLTVQSLRYRPSPLDLLTVPRDQGGVFPHLEILLGSSGVGVSIESLLTGEQLRLHLASAVQQLDELALPAGLRPEGWWSTMDAPMRRVPRSRAARPVRLTHKRPYVQVRFHSRAQQAPGASEPGSGGGQAASAHSATLRRIRRRSAKLIRSTALASLFEPYRPYEDFEAGPVIPEIAATVKGAGLSYMLTKSGFGGPPAIQHRDGDFVALNYTAGRWDGWTPFETVNDVVDLRRAERRLTTGRQPGWLLGTVDSCLWTFSGELWHAAPRLAAIADFAVSGGASGRLVNVTPRVIARYARMIESTPASA
jgi:hypothetical protein